MPDSIAPSPDAHAHLDATQKAALAAQLVTEVAQLLQNEVDNAYALGTNLNRLHQGNLYRQTGAKTWADFLDQQVKLGRTQAEKWMRIASHFSKEAVEKYGVEVLATYAQILDRAHTPAPTDLGTATIATADGAKALDQLTGAELKAAGQSPHAVVPIPAADQQALASLTTSLAAVGPTVHSGGVGTHEGTRVTLSFLLADQAAVGAAHGGAAPAMKPTAKKKPAPKKKPAAKKPAPKKATKKPAGKAKKSR